ncbi:hypothetical protein NMY3_02593 [Candidatus Nitrosocosmicus oleophilus]|uniref:Uncharacterized protein n=2 Tax=Candidatus Nitrosocosmicus oleophilus TaxID=1353260 RepID=A0A654LZ16_9ARCH|nr:hypothetical protein NMY3_02593 [Candidatus Nitrosocosmicus oleophilus]
MTDDHEFNMKSKYYWVTFSLVMLTIILNISTLDQTIFGQSLFNQLVANENANQTITPPSAESNLSVNESQSNNIPIQWVNISGHWTSDERGFHGGSDGSGKVLVSNIILDPAINNTIENLSTSFRINDLNMVVPNYVAIVHSFLDSNNYKYAGINLFDDAIYGIFYNVTNGILTSYPQWPGIKTDLNWKPGTLFNMSLVNHDSSLDLIINGTTYYSIPVTEDFLSDGMVGLDYGRIKDLDFFSFTTEQPNNSVGKSYTTQDSQTILLDGKTIPGGEYIQIYDSSPYKILSGHVAMNLPCDGDGSTDLNVLVGQVPNLNPADLELVDPLSTLGELCLYHVNVASDETNPITDIAIQNNSTDDIEFPSKSSILISLNEMSRP